MTITLPKFFSQFSVPQQVNQFIAVQSANLPVSNSGGTGSARVTFTALPGTQRISFTITNSGTKGCYIAGGDNTIVAVASSSTPTPTSLTGTTGSTCDYVLPGASVRRDFLPGTTSIAAICGGTDTTTLEISIGM